MIRSEPGPHATENAPRLLPRVDLARVIVFAEAPMLGVIALYALSALHDYPAFVLSAVGAGLLVWGGVRIGHDRPAAPAVPRPFPADSPWDWTDVLLFFPGAYTVGQVLISISVSITHALTPGVDPAVGRAAESAVAQAAYYAGALFNLWVLVRLRRGATLPDLGWRRFAWWWLPIAVVGAAATFLVAGYLQDFNQHLFPNVQNSQCVAVRHDYGHVIVLAVFVVCFVAPVAEETIFRGFLYRWMRGAAGVPAALALSAVVFSLVHAVTVLYVPLFAVGVVLAVFYERSRSIWPGAVVHGLFNLPGIIFILNATSC